MKTYRFGVYVDWASGNEYYCIQEKKWWGWREIVRKEKSRSGEKDIKKIVKRLIKFGNLVV